MQKIIIYIALIVLVASAGLKGQSLKVTRTDVELKKAGYVTATYLFGFDISVDSLKRCNGIAFQLNCDKPDYIKFSDSHVTGFGTNPQSLIVPGDSNNPGVLYVGILAGDTAGSAGYSDPQIIHLEFVATPSAVNGEKVSFAFSNTEVVVSNDTSRVILKIKTQTISFNVHGYTDVYPGDANNDGTVDIRDVSQIGVFLGYGDGKNGIRGFRRKDASTFWTPQPALAWDSINPTYADCDGNGIVTINDMLLVALNYGKGWSGAQKSDDLPLAGINEKPEITAESVMIPFYADIPESVKGLTAKLIISGYNKAEYKGFLINDNFKSRFFSFSKFYPENSSVDLAVGSTSASLIVKGRQLVGYLIFDNHGDNLSVLGSTDGNCIAESGNILPFNSVTGVAETGIAESVSFRYNQQANSFTLSNLPSEPAQYILYDISGRIICSQIMQRCETELPLSLTPGKYFITLFSENKVSVFNFVKN